jgi:hypothetical protein
VSSKKAEKSMPVQTGPDLFCAGWRSHLERDLFKNTPIPSVIISYI